jgi:hypothetical protein
MASEKYAVTRPRLREDSDDKAHSFVIVAIVFFENGYDDVKLPYLPPSLPFPIPTIPNPDQKKKHNHDYHDTFRTATTKKRIYSVSSG